MNNFLEKNSPPGGAEYITQQKYTEAVAFYRQCIQNDPTVKSNYWHLCLALILQGQVSDAWTTWMSVIEQASLEQVEAWAAELIEVLTIEIFRREAACDFQVVSKMRNYTNRVRSMARYEAWNRAKGYRFTDDWFSHCLPLWEQYLMPFANIPGLNALEIGSWEGRSTCWLLDNILTHESSRIICIDTFKASVEHKAQYKESYIKSVEEQFDFNISKTGVSEKVQKIVGRSQKVMRSLPLNHYDILYIDGSHLASDVLTDAVLGWELVKIGGLIVFDDYGFEIPDNSNQNTKIGIDAFMTAFCNTIQIIHQDYQVIVKKIS